MSRSISPDRPILGLLKRHSSKPTQRLYSLIIAAILPTLHVCWALLLRNQILGYLLLTTALIVFFVAFSMIIDHAVDTLRTFERTKRIPELATSSIPYREFITDIADDTYKANFYPLFGGCVFIWVFNALWIFQSSDFRFYLTVSLYLVLILIYSQFLMEAWSYNVAVKACLHGTDFLTLFPRLFDWWFLFFVAVIALTIFIAAVALPCGLILMILTFYAAKWQRDSIEDKIWKLAWRDHFSLSGE